MNISKNSSLLPTHIGIIMDGNRRWAKNHFLPTLQGHSRGAETLKSICLYCNKIGIKYLTVYAFSTENWKRSENEIEYLMKLFKKYLTEIIEDKLGAENIKINILGDTSKFSEELKDLILKIEEKSSKNTGIVLNVALNYGGRQEMIKTVNSIISDFENKKIDKQNITEEYISSKTYFSNQPDPDLIIRTAGEKRLSNFMMWQSVYSELYFTSVLWPDFNEKELDKAIEEYSKRVRRFGGA